MGPFLRLLLNLPFFKPLFRFLIGVVAIPVFRLFLRKVIRLQQMSAELEKDLEQWFRGVLLLLVATKNMEDALFGWVPLDLEGKHAWLFIAARLMLAIGVTEVMPDQALFQIIHANPPPPLLKGLPFFRRWGRWTFWMLKATLCKHLDRSSQVFAILTAIFDGTIGWICYLMAIIQYLIIGLVTNRERAADVLATYDQQVRLRRDWLVHRLHLPAELDSSEHMDDWYPIEARPERT